MSFFKQNSNAKRMNELCFQINSTVYTQNIIKDLCNKNMSKNEVAIKSNKINKTLSLDNNDLSILDLSQVRNSTILSYYTELLLLKKALEWIFTDTEEEYHKYISITFNCSNVYSVNVLKEWLNRWYGVKLENEDNTTDETKKSDELSVPFDHELFTIYSYIRKCKVAVN